MGRGRNLFGVSGHDSGTLRRMVDIPVAGMFSAGEIAPVQGATFVHGYSSVFGLIRPRTGDCRLIESPPHSGGHDATLPAGTPALAAVPVPGRCRAARPDGGGPRGLRGLSEPALSPDGSRVVYTLRETDLAADRGRTDLWLLELDG